jgi:AraC-like DNA-binding protein
MQEHGADRHPATYRSSSIDETCRIVAGIYCDHRLEQVRSSEQLDYLHVHQPLDAVSFSEMRYGAEVRIAPGALQTFFLVQVPVSGHDRLRVDGTELSCDPRHVSIHVPDRGLEMDWSADCSKFVVRIERAALERHAATVAGRNVAETLSFLPIAELDSPMVRAWVNTARHMFSELRRNPSLADEPLVRSDIEQLLMTTAMNWLPRSSIVTPRRSTCLVLPRHVRQAEEYMRACAGQPITVDMLAQHVGVSGRALYDGFRRFLGVSPMRYLRDLRMDHVRADLLDPAEPNSVTKIATRWGFFQLGRFAVDYRQRFGESPHETLAKSR